MGTKLIFLIAFFFSQIAIADNWYAVANPASHTYSDKNQCQQTEGQSCFNITACPLDSCSLNAGVYTQDAAKIAAKQAAAQASATAATARAARVARIKAACAAMTGAQQDICNQVVDGP